MINDSDAPVYSITLDPMSNLRLDWTVDYDDDCVCVELHAKELPPQSWLAVGFSDRGDWSSADLCVAWEDWKGFLHVQVTIISRISLLNSTVSLIFQGLGMIFMVLFLTQFE